MDAELRVVAPWLQVGRRTYWANDVVMKAWLPGERIIIGNFCSIAEGVTILTGGGRRMDTAALYPLDIARSYRSTRDTRVGSDVWIGTGAMIHGGVEIGDGAVVAGGSVVFEDVPPFAVVAGNPASVIRYRFSPAVVERLLRVAWWRWPDEMIEANVDWLYAPIGEFLDRFDPEGGAAAHARPGADAGEPARVDQQ
jgi:acetyltransferase-like isoleucine patch superfamily enzyme